MLKDMMQRMNSQEADSAGLESGLFARGRADELQH